MKIFDAVLCLREEGAALHLPLRLCWALDVAERSCKELRRRRDGKSIHWDKETSPDPRSSFAHLE